MASPMLDRAKIQAQVLVPVLRAFREEFGEERANRVAWRALADWRRELARQLHAGMEGSPRERFEQGLRASLPDIGDAVDFELRAQDEERIEFDITGCRFAQLFRELGEPELCLALLCSMDDTIAEEIGAGDVTLTRTGTIMGGASHCDFRYRLRAAAKGV